MDVKRKRMQKIWRLLLYWLLFYHMLYNTKTTVPRYIFLRPYLRNVCKALMRRVRYVWILDMLFKTASIHWRPFKSGLIQMNPVFDNQASTYRDLGCFWISGFQYLDTTCILFKKWTVLVFLKLSFSFLLFCLEEVLILDIMFLFCFSYLLFLCLSF